jgi:hypothetical protein
VNRMDEIKKIKLYYVIWLSGAEHI